MKIYGIGLFKAPGTERVIHDFIEGPFDTCNAVLIDAARKQGFSFEPLAASVNTIDDKPVEPVAKKKKRWGII